MRKIKNTLDFLYDEILVTDRLIWLLLSIGWMVIIFYLSSLPDLQLKNEWEPYDFVLRKIAHMTEYGMLAVLWKNATRNYYIAGMIAFLYAISDEVHQHYVPTRHGAPTDILIDSVGIIVGLYILRSIKRWLERSQSHETA